MLEILATDKLNGEISLMLKKLYNMAYKLLK
jgi:hypothetical protein